MKRDLLRQDGLPGSGRTHDRGAGALEDPSSQNLIEIPNAGGDQVVFYRHAHDSLRLPRPAFRRDMFGRIARGRESWGDPREFLLKSRSEDLVGQVADDRHEFRKHEAKAFFQLGMLEGVLRRQERLAGNARCLQLERGQDRISLHAVGKNPLAYGLERDLSDGAFRATPHGVPSRFEEKDQAGRGGVLGHLIHPRAHIP